MIGLKISLLIRRLGISKICIKYTTQVCLVDKHARPTIPRVSIMSASFKTEQKDATRQMLESCLFRLFQESLRHHLKCRMELIDVATGKSQ